MEVCDIATLGGSRFDAVATLQQHFDLQLDPHLPPTTSAELHLAATVDHTGDADHVRLAAFLDERPLALGHLEIGHDPANPQLASAEVLFVDNQADAGRAVLAEIVDRAEAAGRTSLMGWGPLTEPLISFWTELGVPERYVERLRELDLAAVDERRMTAWIDARHERAADVDLVAWVGVCPARHLDAFVAARNAMRDAPIDDLEMADVLHTAASTRREEISWAAIGWEALGLLAVTPDGDPAGLSMVLLNTHRPAASWQGDTVVLEEHRRRGIGRWLKAEMWRSLRLDRPEVTTLRTGNAASNSPMLSINAAMDYRPTHDMAVWQADTASIRDGLARRSAGAGSQ